MPVARENYVIEIQAEVEDNRSESHKFLAKIFKFYMFSPNHANYDYFLILQKALFESFDVNTQEISLSELKTYFNENGLPKDFDVISMPYAKWDGIESLSLISYGRRRRGAHRPIKSVSFHRFNPWTREIIFGDNTRPYA